MKFKLFFLFFLLSRFCFAEKLQFIGNPLLDYSIEAAKINTLKAFENKLYLGFGDAGYNTGETDIIAYDPKSKTFNIEARVQDEAITQYNIIDSFLVIPGVDATEEWDLGNLYYRTKNQTWIKRRTIPNGVHVFDALKHDNAWFIGTGNFFSLSKDDNNIYAFGGIFSSQDFGKSWSLSYATPSDTYTTFRIHQLFKIGTELYATFYGYYPLDPKTLTPKEIEKYKDVPRYQGSLLFVREDLYGASDILHYKNGFWQVEDLLDVENLAYFSVLNFLDRALITTYSGEKIPYQSLFKFADKQIFLLKNENIKLASLPFDFVVASTKDENELTCLVTIDKKPHLATTADLEHWTITNLNTQLALVAIEKLNDEVYFGDKYGNLFKYNKDENQTEFIIQALKFSQGKRYQFQIASWKDCTKKAMIHSKSKQDSIILNSENVTRFFVALKNNQKGQMTILVDGQKWEQKIPEKTSVIEFNFKEKWDLKLHNTKLDSLKIIEPILGEIDFEADTIYEIQQTYKIKAIAKAVQPTIIISGTGFRAKWEDKNIRASDIFRINYDNMIYKVLLNGKYIKEILKKDCSLSYWHKNTFDVTRLENETLYEVAVTDYFYNKNLKNIEKQNTKITINEAMIHFFKQ